MIECLECRSSPVYPAACKYLTVPAVPRFVRVHEFLLLAERGDKWRAGFPRFVVDNAKGGEQKDECADLGGLDGMRLEPPLDKG